MGIDMARTPMTCRNLRATANCKLLTANPMSDSHKLMKEALMAIVLPRLRQVGFTGSFPHLRRRCSDRIDLLTFQFDRYGGGFIIEISQCAPEGFTTYWGKQIPPEKVRAWDVPNGSARIQPRKGSGMDCWFRYDHATTTESFAKVAETVLPLLKEAEELFSSKTLGVH